MGLPMFSLRQAADSLPEVGELEGEQPHEKAKGAREVLYRVPEGLIILTIWKKSLHCVTYQTPLENESDRKKRSDTLFIHYAGGRRWREVLDNGFGKSYWRSDRDLFALWSYVMDITTFMTKEFHGVNWG